MASLSEDQKALIEMTKNCDDADKSFELRKKSRLMALRSSATPKFSDGRRRRRTSNVGLPLELGSDRRETSATRVSDDLQISIFRRRKFVFGKNSDFFFGFSLFSADFRGARLFLTSKSSSSRFFALDGQIFRCVRRLELIFGFFIVHTSPLVEKQGCE